MTSIGVPQGLTLLTHDEINKIAQHINTRALNSSDPCQVCGGQSSVLPYRANIPVGDFESGTKYTFPVAMTICDNCGFVRMFGAEALGVEQSHEKAVRIGSDMIEGADAED